MSKSKTVEEKYQKLTQIEHILKRPDTYIGDTKLQKEKQYVYENDKIIGGVCLLNNRLLTEVLNKSKGSLNNYNFAFFHS